MTYEDALDKATWQEVMKENYPWKIFWLLAAGLGTFFVISTWNEFDGDSWWVIPVSTLIATWVIVTPITWVWIRLVHRIK